MNNFSYSQIFQRQTGRSVPLSVPYTDLGGKGYIKDREFKQIGNSMMVNRLPNYGLQESAIGGRIAFLTLPLKNVSLAEWLNADKENVNDEDIKGAVDAGIRADAVQLGQGKPAKPAQGRVGACGLSRCNIIGFQTPDCHQGRNEKSLLFFQ